jgi:choline dehydrogenase-like flavoprotein
VIYETAPTTPALGAGFIPWHGAEQHAERMRQLGHLAPIVAITRDRDSGEVKIRRDGEPVVSYKLSSYDAVEAFSCHQRPVGFEPGRCGFAALHIMGTARMGGSPAMSATNPDGETWDLSGLVVADGSSFPTASGVNPMISIESIAHMSASRLAARLA